MKKNTKAVILAGGLGTRLHPFSFTIPKPLMPIGKDTILLHLINRFKKFGVNNFLISIGYQAELMKAYIGKGDKFNISVKYFEEEKPLGTAGPIGLMKKEFSKNEYFFLVNGDIYTEVDFSKMYEFAVRGKYDIVVGHIEKNEKSSYGILDINQNQIKGIIEKPTRTFCISSGMYVINSNALNSIPSNQYFTMPDLINSYLRQKKPVGTIKIDKFWMGIEDVESLEEVLERTKKINPI